jgi:hypothetical protein
MDGIARAPAEERAELFRQSASNLSPDRSPAIIEKDFWVCWTLYRIYDVMRFRPQMIFKGGTSLSKAYNAIERFSEDVDLSLSREDLGFSEERDPEEPGISGNESSRRIDALVAACKEAIAGSVLPGLREDFTSVIGTDGWNVELDGIDPQTVIFAYPPSELTDELSKAVLPSIRLEMGARSDDWPTEDREIRPYAAVAFPGVFTTAASCRVHVMDAKRTFWEKATLLHAEYNRPADRDTAERLSRHYYDLFQLSRLEIGRQAVECRELLERVVAHKQMFFPAAWARYQEALDEGIHLVPNEDRLASLRTDYAAMREMIFGDLPEWEDIMEGLRGLEDRINDP